MLKRWNFLKTGFYEGIKSSPSSDEGLEKLSSAPPGIGSEGAPSGATMVLSTVPSYTAWPVVRKGANQGSVYDLKPKSTEGMTMQQRNGR